MSSPFPGMDPYIESSGLWGDSHGTMLSAMRADLNARLPRGFVASIELCVWASSVPTRGSAEPKEPDVLIRRHEYRTSAASTATIKAPSKTVLPRRAKKRHKYLKVVDVQTRQVVTVVKLLRPSNKRSGEDRNRYLEKRIPGE